jgi:DNA repair ATPase RecN
MGIKDYKVFLKWLRYPGRYLYNDLRDLSIHFLDGTVISGATDDPYDLDNTKVLTSSSLTDIINTIKEIVNDVKEIIDDIKEITQNIKEMVRTIKDLKDRLDNDESKIEEQKTKNAEQDETLDEHESL